MDKSTLPGLMVGLGAVLLTNFLEGGSPARLLNVPAATIVFGGMLGVALIAFPLGRLLNMPKLFVKAMTEKATDEAAVVSLFVRLAEKARREGLLALESEAAPISEPFIQKGIMLVVDGTDPELVRSILEADLDAMTKRHASGYQMFESLGGYGPTLGIIGTVMGLVNVLSSLDSPDSLGHSIATAFIATLYGIASANLVWLPIGSKLKVKSKREAESGELVIEGVLSVQAGDNPRIVREKLEAFLPPAHRQRAETGTESMSGRVAEAAA